MDKEDILRVLQLESFESKALFHGKPELVELAYGTFTTRNYLTPNIPDFKCVFSGYDRVRDEIYEFDKIFKEHEWLRILKYDNYRLSLEILPKIYTIFNERTVVFHFYFLRSGDLQSYKQLIDEIYQFYSNQQFRSIAIDRYEEVTEISVTSKIDYNFTTIEIHHKFAKTEKHLIYSLPRHRQIIFDGKTFKWTNFTEFIFKTGVYVCSALDNFRECFELKVLKFVLPGVRSDTKIIEFDKIKLIPDKNLQTYNFRLKECNGNRLDLCFLEDLQDEIYSKSKSLFNRIYGFLNEGKYSISIKTPDEEQTLDHFQGRYRESFRDLALHFSKTKLLHKGDFNIAFAEQAKEMWNEMFIGDEEKIIKLADQRCEILEKEMYEEYKKSYNTILREMKPKLLFSVGDVYREMYSGFHCTIDWPAKVQIVTSQRQKNSLFGLLNKDLLKLIFFWVDALHLGVIRYNI